MRFVMRTLQAIGMAGLIAVTAVAAEGQTKSARNSTGSAVAATPRSATTAPRSVLQQSPEVSSRMARRLAGPGAKTVTVDDVVEGGVYYEDPVSGKLILGEAPPKGPINVPDGVAPRVASRSPGTVRDASRRGTGLRLTRVRSRT